jgi:hypothetical protein
MWMYPRPSCPNHPFSEELGEVEINTRIHRVHDHGADLNLGVDPTHIREGVDNTRVSLSAFTFDSSCHFDLLMVFTSVRSVWRILTVRHRGSPYLSTGQGEN